MIFFNFPSHLVDSLRETSLASEVYYLGILKTCWSFLFTFGRIRFLRTEFRTEVLTPQQFCTSALPYGQELVLAQLPHSTAESRVVCKWRHHCNRLPSPFGITGIPNRGVSHTLPDLRLVLALSSDCKNQDRNSHSLPHSREVVIHLHALACFQQGHHEVQEGGVDLRQHHLPHHHGKVLWAALLCKCCARF